jgi:hypothetical protein
VSEPNPSALTSLWFRQLFFDRRFKFRPKTIKNVSYRVVGGTWACRFGSNFSKWPLIICGVVRSFAHYSWLRELLDPATLILPRPSRATIATCLALVIAIVPGSGF